MHATIAHAANRPVADAWDDGAFDGARNSDMTLAFSASLDGGAYVGEADGEEEGEVEGGRVHSI